MGLGAELENAQGLLRGYEWAIVKSSDISWYILKDVEDLLIETKRRSLKKRIVDVRLYRAMYRQMGEYILAVVVIFEDSPPREDDDLLRAIRTMAGSILLEEVGI